MVEVYTRTEIAAPCERVWATLTDFSALPQWNPFIRQIEGELRAGARLRIQIAPPGKSPMRFAPRVLKVTPERELRWLGRVLLPGLFDGEHWFRLTPLDAGRSLFEHGEVFSGVLPALMARSFLEPTRQGFDAMNAALRQRVEAT